MATAIPTPISDKVATEPIDVPLRRDEDAARGRSPDHEPGLSTGLHIAGKAALRAAGGGEGPRSLPAWLVVLLAFVGGSGSQIGARNLLGPDPDVVELKIWREAITKRVDKTEKAIAASDVMRVGEMRYLIGLSVEGFKQLGVDPKNLPALPNELSERYRDIEVEARRQELFTDPPPAPPESGKLPAP